MEPIKISERLKYYRNILDIGQKALVDENISINLIKYVEGGKRRLTIHKAMILSDKFNNIAKEKGVELNVTVKDLLMSDEEYAQKVCMEELGKLDEKVYDEARYNEILDIARTYNLDEVVIEVYEKIGKYYYSITDFKSAIEYNNQALDISIKIKNTEKKLKLLNTLGTCYYLLQDYVYAMDLYTQCYDELIHDATNNNIFLSKILYNLALCNRKLKRDIQVTEFLDKLLAMNNFDEVAVINGMTLKANMLLENQKYEEALQLYKAITAYGPQHLYIVQNNMALTLMRLNRVDESVDMLTKSITDQMESSTSFITSSLLNMGYLYKNECHYNPSIVFFNYAFDSAIKYKQVDFIAECCDNLYMLYGKIDKMNKFKDVLNKLLNFQKNINLDSAQNQIITELRKKYLQNSKPNT